MLVKINHKAGIVFILLCVSLFSLSINERALASTVYPLQSKYPDIMIYRAHTDQKLIAFTFDDGPDDRFTPHVLDVLKTYNVPATFFLLGMRVHKFPDIAKRIHDEGHVIGNHTYWHPELTKTGVENMVWEIEQNEARIKSVTGVKTVLFRAPYGALNDELVQKIGELDYRGVGWSVDSEDWESLSANEVKKNVLSGVHPGAIILMHSAGHWTQDLSGTVEALKELIPYLRKQGYEFVTVPELLDL